MQLLEISLSSDGTLCRSMAGAQRAIDLILQPQRSREEFVRATLDDP